MSATQPTLHHLDLSALALGGSHVDFLNHLPGPTFFTVPGKHRAPRQMLVTLLHGNEPSGLKAICELLAEGLQPATDLAIIIAGVDAARAEPIFSHRYLPQERDLNRCFAPPFNTDQERLAQSILDAIDRFDPSLIIDTHNTSSHSRPFCVASHDDEAVLKAASRFSDRLIVIEHALGALMQHSSPQRPVVTAEFGGFMDPDADQHALETLESLWLGEPPPDALPVCLKHPLRLETVQDLEVSYSSSLVERTDLTLLNTIDQLNFREVPAGTTLGWYRNPVHKHLVALDAAGRNRFDDWFTESHETLTTLVPMTLFMATTDPLVANADCLFYFTPAA